MENKLLENVSKKVEGPKELYTESGQTSQGSFSAVSKPTVASKYSLESSRRDLHNALLCTVLLRTGIGNVRQSYVARQSYDKFVGNPAVALRS